MRWAKNWRKWLLPLVTTLLLAGCGVAEVDSLGDSSAAEPSTPEQTVSQPEEGEETMQTIQVLAGDKSYTACLYDNETARAFGELLPLQVQMQELNGNEKYVYLSQSLPSDAHAVSTIHAGDLMLFGSDCVVLFYEDFTTSYRYTKIGSLQDPEGLAEALGTGSVSVTFQAMEE